MLYKNLPRNVGLRRLTLHKSATGPNVNYILLVECSHFLDNINQVKTHQHINMTPTFPFPRLPTCCRCCAREYAATLASSG